MPKERSGSHTSASLGLVVEKLGKLQAEIVAHKTALEVESIHSVNVPREPSLEVGIARLVSWVDSLRDAIDSERMDNAKNGVSVSKSEGDKPRKKK